MNMREVSRRQLLNSVGLAAGASLLAGCGEASEAAPSQGKPAPSERIGSRQPPIQGGSNWKYVKLDPATVAAEAYRLVPQGGCSIVFHITS